MTITSRAAKAVTRPAEIFQSKPSGRMTGSIARPIRPMYDCSICRCAARGADASAIPATPSVPIGAISVATRALVALPAGTSTLAFG